MAPLSYKQFPLRVYQITNKYRDEIKPRFGLMRAREFLMKDLYTFDIDEYQAKETYRTVCECYEAIFKKIGVTFTKGKVMNKTFANRVKKTKEFSIHLFFTNVSFIFC